MNIVNHAPVEILISIFIMTKQHYLSRNEKIMVTNVHSYLKRVDARDTAACAGGLRKRVAMCVGIGERSVDRILKESTDHGGVFPEASPLPPRGPPPFSYDENLVTVVRSIVREKNLASQPTSIKDILSELPKRDGEDIISKRTLNRLLQRAGFYFGKGKKVNALIETDAIRTLRARYLRLKLANRNGKGLPIIPEVYLDESYCHKNHTKSATWVDAADMANYVPSGKGPRAVMIGAGVIRAQSNKLVAEFVPDSLKIWEAKAAEKEDDDYHGNFDAEIFDGWFDDLCYTAMMQYGPVIFHMDGAKYHLRNLSPTPTNAWLKAKIQEWLTAHGVHWEWAMLKPELLSLAKAQNVPKDYACVRIAANYGHRVLITPPYHPELQPIEIIWAVVKNTVAMSPPRTLKELIALLFDLFKTKVKSKTWIGAFKKAQGFEDMYWEQEATDESVEESETDDEEAELYAF